MQLSVLKSYADCELSTFTSKFDMFPGSLKNTLCSPQTREHENSVPAERTKIKGQHH